MVEEVMIRSKEMFYKGLELEDLKKLDVRESAKYLPSRSRRSVLRHFEIIERFIKRCQDSVAHNKKIRTHLRDIVIVPNLVGFKIGIHNGKTFSEVLITHRMIGHRLGEFAPTRTKVSHGAPGIGATKSSSGDKK